MSFVTHCDRCDKRVREGDDEPAEWAQAWLREVDDGE